jgi:hypothetical protein
VVQAFRPGPAREWQTLRSAPQERAGDNSSELRD